MIIITADRNQVDSHLSNYKEYLDEDRAALSKLMDSPDRGDQPERHLNMEAEVS